MNKKTTVMVAAVGLFSLIGFASPEPSSANHYARYAKQGKAHREAARRENRNDWAELRKDRAELRRDQAELERDRAELRRLYRRNTSRAEIERKKAEIRDDLRELNRDRREIWESYNDLRRDGDYYCYGGWYDNRDRWRRDNQSWWGWGNGWWNSGRDRGYR
jgi:hypothetical protein